MKPWFNLKKKIKFMIANWNNIEKFKTIEIEIEIEMDT